MVFRLVWLLLLFSLGVLFAGVNARNMCDLSVIVHTFRDIPVYAGLIAAFLLGVLWTIPFLLKKRGGKKRKEIDKPQEGPYSSEETGA